MKEEKRTVVTYTIEARYDSGIVLKRHIEETVPPGHDPMDHLIRVLKLEGNAVKRAFDQFPQYTRFTVDINRGCNQVARGRTALRTRETSCIKRPSKPA